LNRMDEEEKKASPPSTDDSPQQSEQLNTSSTDGPIASVEETTNAEQPKTINYKPEIEQDMEVHHHTHHEHGKKNWKVHLREFLMLFFAVFSGFLAEYKLEHIIENQREKKYAQTLYEDLKVDTSILAFHIREVNFIIPKIDTFRWLAHSRAIEEIPAGTWMYYGRFPTFHLLISLQDATMQQLLNSGGLRLFQKQNVADAIARYSQSKRTMEDFLKFQDLMDGDIVKARNVLFDTWYLDEIMDINASADKIDSFKKKQFTLLSNKKEDFIQYANLCQLRSWNFRHMVTRLGTVSQRANGLLALLKKEYELE
jgi:hypothetical protein